MKINTSRTKVMKETVKAYADANMPWEQGYKLRNLNFRASSPVNKLEAVQIMCEALACSPSVEAYNNFRPELLMILPDDAKVTLAREASVCVYFTTQKPVEISAFQKAILADEFNQETFTTHTTRKGTTYTYEYRVWWD